MRRNLNNLTEAELDALIAQKRRQDKTAEITPKPNLQNTSRRMYMPDEGATMAFGRGALDSASLGFGPKILGGLGALARPEFSYEELRNIAREQNQASAEAHPYATFAGNVAGSAALPFPAKTLPGALGLGAGYGALYGLGSNDAGEVGTLGQSDLDAALQYGTLGALAGGIGKKVGDIGNYLGKRAFNVREKPNPEALERIALSERFGVPLTKGEVTGAPRDIFNEEAALKGRLGDKKEKTIKEFVKNRGENFKESAENLRNELGGGQPYLEKGAHLGPAIDKVKAKALSEREQYSNLYQAAKENVAEFEADGFGTFINLVEKDLEEEIITPNNSPKAYALLNDLKDIVGKTKKQEANQVELEDFVKLINGDESIPLPQSTISYKPLEAWRQSVNRAYKTAIKSGDEQTAYALNQIKDKFDGFMDGLIESKLAEGSPEALEQLMKGRGLAAEWFKKYTAKNLSEVGKKFLQNVINNERLSDTPYTPEQISNMIFGLGELGFKAETGPIIKELKKHMSAEDFNAIKLEAGQKLITPLLKETPNVTTYNNNLRKFISSSPTLAKELFTKEELKALQDIGKLGQVAFTRPKSLVNPSGTADVIIDYFKYGKFIKNLFNKAELNQNKIKRQVSKGDFKKTEIPISTKGLPVTQALTREGPKEEIEPNVKQENRSLSNLSEEELERLIARKSKGSENKLLNKISKVESNNNPNAKSNTSTASGLFQFTNSTAKRLQKKYGITGSKNDPDVQRKMAMALIEENKEILNNNLGRAPTDKELYIAHFLGPKDAVKLIEQRDSSTPAVRLFPSAAKANRSIFFKGSKPRSLSEVYQTLTKKI